MSDSTVPPAPVFDPRTRKGQGFDRGAHEPPHSFQENGRKLRNVYTCVLTAFTLLSVVLIALLRTGGVAEHAVDSLCDALDILILTFLSTSIADRTGVLSSFASRLRFGPGNTPPSPPPS